jgi:hypothetical protein
VQQDPEPGAPATERTEVWVLFDDKTLYVSARLWNSHPERELSNDSRRDAPLFRATGDSFNLGLDTFLDRRNGYQFGVTPRGGMYDSISVNERDVNRDWNGVWQVRTSHFEMGWSLEMAIPFKTLRYGGSGDQTWGINVLRATAWKNEVSYFTRVPPALGPGFGLLHFSSAAKLVGLTLPPSSRLFEIKPYLNASLASDRVVRPVISNDPSGDLGVDLKYGLTRGLTADFTYNTDFAQVEADEQQVNLTRFSLFFPETREFFLEGSGIFSFGGVPARREQPPGDLPVLFFSRRIGINESRVVPILGGARVTGKAGPYSIGAVAIETDDEPGSRAPRTNFTILRVKRDILRRSHVGAMLTNRSRSAVTAGSNQAYGVDAVFSFYENLNINSFYSWTDTPGRSGRSASYRGQLDYNADRYGLQAERLVVDENFNPEVGYSRRQDFVRHMANARFSPRPSGIASVRKFAWEGLFDHFTNSAGRLDTRIVQGLFRTEFQSSDRLVVQVTDDYEFVPRPFNIFGTVTLPVGAYRFKNFHAQYEAGYQHNPSGTLAYDQGGFYGGTKKTLAYSLGRLKLTRDLQLEPTFSLNWVDVPQGRFVAKVVTTRAIYPLNPRTFASALIQYNSTTHGLSTNARFRWEYQPGSDLFVVYSDGRDTLANGFPELQNRAFVVKITRLFRM